MATNNVAAVKEVYDLARRARHKELRELLADDVTWYPAREGAWNPCVNADQVVRTLLWRTSANRMRPAEMIEVGDRVFIRLRGARLHRLGATAYFFPKLFQVVVLRGGKVTGMHDYALRDEALAAAGLRT